MGIFRAGSDALTFVDHAGTGEHRLGLAQIGSAVDLNIDGVLDTLGDGRIQLGLIILSDFFGADADGGGWVWGCRVMRQFDLLF